MPASINEIIDSTDGSISHLVIRLDLSGETKSARNDLIQANEFIQCALIEMVKNQTFEPHIHPLRSGHSQTLNTQEAWVVISGNIEATLFDVRGKIAEVVELNAGDLCITLRGGHNYKSLSESTVVYEFKTGPYLGADIDKVPISKIKELDERRV